MSTNRIKTRRTASTLVRTVLLGVCLVMYAASCGQRGPLYLPKQDAHSGSVTSADTRADENPEPPIAEPGGEDTTGDDEDSNEETP